MHIIGGSSNYLLLEDICTYLTKEKDFEITPTKTLLGRFSDGETRVEINENLRGQDVFVIQSLSSPVNDNLMELLLILDTLKRSDVHSVTVILPYYGYSRQDKKIRQRVPISAKVVADCLGLYQPKRIVTLDLHSNQIQGFFNCPVDNLYGSIVFLPYMKRHKNNLICISPDAGGTERVAHYAKKLNCEMAFCYKHRNKPNEIGEMRLVGEVKGKDCLIIDDMADTCNTLIEASKILIENKASSVHAYVTHGVLSGHAVKKLKDSQIESFSITDSILPTLDVMKCNKFRLISIAPLLGESILRLSNGESLSEMFK
jgi:ribose-phosphate pyrophosphokinase